MNANYNVALSLLLKQLKNVQFKCIYCRRCNNKASFEFHGRKKVHIFFHWIERLLSIWNMSHTFAQRCQNVLLFIFTFTYYNTNAIVIVVYLYLSIWEFAVFSRIFAIENFLDFFFFFLLSSLPFSIDAHTFIHSPRFITFITFFGDVTIFRVCNSHTLWTWLFFEFMTKEVLMNAKAGINIHHHSWMLGTNMPNWLNIKQIEQSEGGYVSGTECVKWFRHAKWISMDVCTMQSNA